MLFTAVEARCCCYLGRGDVAAGVRLAREVEVECSRWNGTIEALDVEL
jgi:hypothetical protein